MSLKINNSILVSILILFLAIGLIGFYSPYNKEFEKLSIYNLLLTFILVFLSFYSDRKIFIRTFLIIFCLGFTAEQIGVHTSLLFGEYSYGDNLGVQLFDVPIAIGINWAILSIGAWHISSMIKLNKFRKILLASLLMVFFDLIMEPSAIYLVYWSWDHGTIPLYNYLSWFIISIPAMFVCSKFQNKDAGITKTVFIAQLLFFSLINIKSQWF